jgi:hypothetical protein
MQDGRWVRGIDLTPAAAHGELVFLMPPGNEGPSDPAVAIQALRAGLATFSAADFLLPVGHPLYIAWAAALAVQASGGPLCLLHWRPRERCYAVVRSDLPAPPRLARAAAPGYAARRAGAGADLEPTELEKTTDA